MDEFNCKQKISVRSERNRALYVVLRINLGTQRTRVIVCHEMTSHRKSSHDPLREFCLKASPKYLLNIPDISFGRPAGLSETS